MKRLLVVTLNISVLLAGSSLLLAKGKTVKIVIEGADLPKPIDIADPKVLPNFNVWAGPGTSSTSPSFNANAPSFIIDWSQGPVTQVPQVLQKYRVSFYVNYQNDERIAYVVFYAYDPATRDGYVYLPGKSDQNYRLNVGTIFRGVEGNWFHAWSAWENIARPLITKARANSSRFEIGRSTPG
jgi:hypothetical protein